MTKEHVKRLRNASKLDRTLAAIELALTESDEAVRELIRMAKGKKGLLRRCTLEEQVLAIEALGLTRREEALHFLTKTYTPRIWRAGIEHTLLFSFGYDACGHFDDWKESDYGDVDFPRAPRRLASRLAYRDYPSSAEARARCAACENKYPSSPAEAQPYDADLHSLFRNAIFKLKTSVKRF